MRLFFFIVSIMLFVISGCKSKKGSGDNGLHFTLLNSSETNIDFNNKITESDSVNVFINEYLYNGSGVGVGDFNNDGLADLFFSGSMVSSKLYINKGNLQFEDITEKAGVQTGQWCTGVSIVDINNDGFSDIYLCSSHSPDIEKRRNLLFINDGKLHFTEQAAAYNLADTGFSTQAAFFDYDKDGDIDMYLLNHRLYNHNTVNNFAKKDTSGNSPAEDRLYRNEGVPAGQLHAVFRDVSKQAGIKEDGYGLGVVITDVNNDNWPDVYVANDYIGNDLLWLNKKDGTFENVIATSLKHQSFNSMGVDAADINNDCLPDLAVLDMMPETNERKKMMFIGTSPEKYDMERKLGYEPSFIRNMLQLNNGTRKVGNRNEPFYSEIGQLAGISETDWSWSVLMADFDNDGWKDIHITNGLAKDVTNNDFVAFRTAQDQNYAFGGKVPANPTDKNTVRLLRKHLDEYGSIKISNYFFHNDGNLSFSNTTEQSGLNNPSVSNGASYVDLDNDGDLDLVVNNMNQEAFVYRNETRKSIKDSTKNFVAFQLKGPPGNVLGLASKVSLFNKGNRQFVEQSPVRGFLSGVDYRLHFGVGNIKVVDSIKIQWPDDKVQVLKSVAVNQLITLKYEEAQMPATGKEDTLQSTIFNDVTAKLNIDYKHNEAQYYDFGSQRAVPQKFSQLGPALATGDVNGDGLMDFFAGGAALQSGKIFIQHTNGQFVATDLVAGVKEGEDVGADFFDSDGDNDLDLLITGGSPEFGSAGTYNQPRLFINDGKGNFKLDTQALPQGITAITKAVAIADYDNDGDADIFIGGRVVPQKYPKSPRSYLLQNEHGKFKDVTKQVCPELEYGGLITSAVFADFNNDKQTDLLVCGEWMPVRFFKNDKGKFTETTANTGLTNMNGLWRTLQATDVDKDGDMDFVAGNIGLNNKYRISNDKPVMFYAKDVDKNGYADLIPAYHLKDEKGRYELFPGIDRSLLAEEIPSVKKKYLLFKDFAKVNMEQLLNDYGKDGWTSLKCERMESVWIENFGNEKFKTHRLPVEAQFAPVNSIVADDLNNDGNVDLVLAGNEYQADIFIGRYDASYGQVFWGDGKGNFLPENIVKSGLMLEGDVKEMRLVEVRGKGKVLIAAVNDDKLKCFKLK